MPSPGYDIYENVDNFLKINENRTELVFVQPQNIHEPFISIIITLYKREDYVHEAIGSAIAQINIDFSYEIIVLCDAPDIKLSSFDIYNDTKNLLVYRNCENIGLYNSTNLSARIARGRYIAFLHDDDILYPEYLFEIGRFLSCGKPQAKCVLVNRDVMGCSGSQSVLRNVIKRLLPIIFFPFFAVRLALRRSFKVITLREGLTYVLSNVYKAPSCGTLFDRKAFIDSGGFNQDFWPVSDYYFFLKFNKNYPVYMLRKKLACYRWFDNLSQNKSVQHTGFEYLRMFFLSPQPIGFVNNYYSFFLKEILYAKFIMIDKKYRNEIIEKYPELWKANRIKWFVFKLYNMGFRFFRDIIA